MNALKKLIILLLSLVMSLTVVACTADEMEVYDDVTQTTDELNKQLDAILNSVDDPAMVEVVKLFKELSGVVKVEDRAYDASQYDNVDDIVDADGRILCYIITDKSTSSIYASLPLIDKTLILDGSVVENQLYNLIEKGTGIKIR